MQNSDLRNLPMTEMECRLKDYMETHPRLKNKILSAGELSALLLRMFQENRMNPFPYFWQSEWAGDPLHARQGGFINQLEQNMPISDSGFATHSTVEHIPPDVQVAASRMIRYMPAHWHTNEFLEIYYAFSGSCALLLENETIWMNPGSLVLLSPFANHATPCYQDDCVLVSYLVRPEAFHVSFRTANGQRNLLSDFLYHALNDHHGDPYLHFELGEDLPLRTLLERLYWEYYGEERYRTELLTLLLHEFLLLLLRGYEDQAIFPSNSHVQWRNGYAELFGYIMNHYQTLTLEKLAGHFNYSNRQLIRILRQCSGNTFTDIILQLRMENAAQMLCTTDRSTEDIAHEVGYHNLSAFHRAFTRYFSTTPAQYRLYILSSPKSCF